MDGEHIIAEPGEHGLIHVYRYHVWGWYQWQNVFLVGFSTEEI